MAGPLARRRIRGQASHFACLPPRYAAVADVFVFGRQRRREVVSATRARFTDSGDLVRVFRVHTSIHAGNSTLARAVAGLLLRLENARDGFRRMRKVPRGGGRKLYEIVRPHSPNEHEWTPRGGAKPGPELPMDGDALRGHRQGYLAAIRGLHAEGRPAGKWPLRYLIRHTAFHTMDHTWEMEDKDLTNA